MALVSNKHNFIFIHIYRTGGNSIRKMLGSPAVGYFTDILGGQEVLGVHANAADVRKHYESNNQIALYDKAWKFAVVRNPYSWMVSVYKYISRSPGHNYYKDLKDKNFDWFLKWYTDTAMQLDRPFGSNKYQFLHQFVLDSEGNQLVDYVGKMENMPVIARTVSEKTGIKIPVIAKINSTAPDSWKSYYNNASIKHVSTIFAKDLEMFGYSY